MLIPRNNSLRRQQVASTSIRSADAKAGYAGCMASARQIEVEVRGSDESPLLEGPSRPVPRASCPAPCATLRPAPRAPHAQRPAAAFGSWRRESRCERAGPPRQRSIADAENATRARRTAASAPGLCGDSPTSAPGLRARRRESCSKRAGPLQRRSVACFEKAAASLPAFGAQAAVRSRRPPRQRSIAGAE
jgi:hypothetical protein